MFFGTCHTGTSSVCRTALMSCISRRMCARVCLLPCSTCQKRQIKDGPKARADLLSMGIREELHANRPNNDDDDDDDDDEPPEDTESRRKGKKAKKQSEHYCPPACFTLSQKEIHQLINCLLGIKLPYGFAGKISRYLDSAKQRFSGMKSHDCHVLMTQLLPVAMRGIMDDHVRETLFGQ